VKRRTRPLDDAIVDHYAQQQRKCKMCDREAIAVPVANKRHVREPRLKTLPALVDAHGWTSRMNVVIKAVRLPDTSR